MEMYASDPEECLIPIFVEARHCGELKQIGTGLFIEFMSELCIFTAAHVTDNIKDSKLWVPAHDGIYPIQGYLGHIDLLPGQTRGQDNIDIAYYKLDTRFAAGMMEFFRPWPQARCQMTTDALSLGVCSIYGLPASRSKRIGASYSSETAAFRGVAALAEEYVNESLSPQSHLIVHFHKKNAVAKETGKTINPIHPRGVSGGGIFAWPEGAELSDDWSLPKLVGIFHTYKESKGLMIGSLLLTLAAAVHLGKMKKFGGIV